MTHKNRKKIKFEISWFEGLDVLFGGSAEGFSLSLDVLHGGLGIKILDFYLKK